MESIYDISLLIKNGKDSAIVISNYLDEFRNATNKERIAAISSKPTGGIMEKGAYLAAVVEQLCLDYNIKIPDWVNKKEYFLKEPDFYSKFENVKAILIQQSPAAFRRRNIFVSNNVLSRV